MTTITTQTIAARSFGNSNPNVYGFQNAKWAATDSGDGYLGGYGTNETVSKSVAVPHGATELTLKFDFLEIDSWNNEHMFVDINGVTVDLGTFKFYSTEGTHGSIAADDDITFQKTAASSNFEFAGSNTYNDQRHTFEINIPGNLITDGTLDIKWHSSLDMAASNEAFGIDNFSVSARIGLADANDYADARSAIQEIDMFSIGSQQLGSLYDTFATRLELMKDGAFDLGQEMGLDLGNLSSSQVRQLETDATNALNTWSASNNGFSEWGTLLWQEMDDQYAPMNGPDGADFLRAVSFMASFAGFVTGGGTVSGALGLGAAAAGTIAGFLEEGGENYPSSPIELPTFTMDEALESLHSELLSRGFNSDASALKNAADAASQDMFDFMSNAQLADYVAEMLAGGVNRLAYKDDIEDLGFNVQSGYHRADQGFGGPIGDSYSWMRITDGAVDIAGVDEIYFRYNGSNAPAFNFDVDFV